MLHLYDKLNIKLIKSNTYLRNTATLVSTNFMLVYYANITLDFTNFCIVFRGLDYPEYLCECPKDS